MATISKAITVGNSTNFYTISSANALDYFAPSNGYAILNLVLIDSTTTLGVCALNSHIFASAADALAFFKTPNLMISANSSLHISLFSGQFAVMIQEFVNSG